MNIAQELQSVTWRPTKRRKGMEHHRARLTESQVFAIRVRYAAGEGGYGYLAHEYGCGESTIRDIVKRKTRT